ncbi:MAG: threonine/serine exporter family protein [Candidatus Wallacebacter cryptica]|nr:threonine/serine exporter family protein [Bacillota bacterium]
MNRYEIGEIIDIACRAGKIILENGGEIYRVEDTMQFVCRAFGIEECDSYATPTMIVISVSDEKGEVFSRMMRIRRRGVNLNKVEAVNNFSRAILHNPITPEEAKAKLAAINNYPVYSFWYMAFAAAVGTSAFTIVFDGGLSTFICGFFLGGFLRLIVDGLNRIQLGFFTVNVIGGAAAALGGWLFTYLGLIPDWWIITLSALMQLVPGLIFTNALRDAAAGDLVSAISRGMEALSIVTALASGAGGTLMLLAKLGGG